MNEFVGIPVALAIDGGTVAFLIIVVIVLIILIQTFGSFLRRWTSLSNALAVITQRGRPVSI